MHMPAQQAMVACILHLLLMQLRQRKKLHQEQLFSHIQHRDSWVVS
jgi:hypothetical protein